MGWQKERAKTMTEQGAKDVLALKARAFNMCGDVAESNLYAVAQQNCLQAPDTRMTVMSRRSGSSSSNVDVERAGPQGQPSAAPWGGATLVRGHQSGVLGRCHRGPPYDH